MLILAITSGLSGTWALFSNEPLIPSISKSTIVIPDWQKIVLVVISLLLICFAIAILVIIYQHTKRRVINKEQVPQKQSLSGVILEAKHDKLRESLISARERAKALLEIGTDAGIADVRLIIQQAYYRHEVAVKYLKQKHRSNPEYLPLIILLQTGQSCLNTLIRGKRNLNICKPELDDNSREIISRIDDIFASVLAQSNTVLGRETKLIIDGKPKFCWHGDRLGRSWRLPIKNVGLDEAEDCRGKLIAIASTIHEVDEGLGSWPVNEYLNWNTGEESISIAPNETMELEVANYEGYGSPLYLAYAKGQDFRKQHALKSFYRAIILVIGIRSKATPTIYAVCQFHAARREDDNLELIEVTSEIHDIKLYQKQDSHNGDSQS